MYSFLWQVTQQSKNVSGFKTTTWNTVCDYLLYQVSIIENPLFNSDKSQTLIWPSMQCRWWESRTIRLGKLLRAKREVGIHWWIYHWISVFQLRKLHHSGKETAFKIFFFLYLWNSLKRFYFIEEDFFLFLYEEIVHGFSYLAGYTEVGMTGFRFTDRDKFLYMSNNSKSSFQGILRWKINKTFRVCNLNNVNQTFCSSSSFVEGISICSEVRRWSTI